MTFKIEGGTLTLPSMNLESKRFRGDVAADIRDRIGYDGDLLGLYANNTGPLVHKWHHYLPLYDRYFGPYRNRALRFLEIGVSRGGSLQLWRRYFGPEAVIFGIDINPKCAALDGQSGKVRIGSQDDPAFLQSVVDEMGGVDVVLDDGSHKMPHIRASLEALFPRLSTGGLYMIEDLHTAYLKAFGGGTMEKDNFFNTVRSLCDDMHHWYHTTPPHHPGLGAKVSGIHIHDSLVVLEKSEPLTPVHSAVGGR